MVGYSKSSQNQIEESSVFFDGRPAWSPDGKSIAFYSDRSGNADIWVMKADGSDPINLTADNKEQNYFFAWSPNGDQIAYNSQSLGNQYMSVWVVNSDGTNAVDLTEQLNLSQQVFLMGDPAWSPKGDFITFPSQDDSGNESILIIETTEWHITTTIPLRPATITTGSIRWSPDGRYIAAPLAQIQGDFEEVIPELWLFSADGTTVWDISDGLKDFLGHGTKLIGLSGVDWSPTSDKLAFATSYSGNDSIFLVNSNGKQLTLLTKDVKYCAYPVWSPNGQHIAFSCVSVDDGGTDIWSINSDGTNLSDLTQSGETLDRYPAWSPDGTRIAYESHCGEDADIWVMNADGSNPVNLTGIR
jgi:Tol biopolymer transport system component